MNLTSYTLYLSHYECNPIYMYLSHYKFAHILDNANFNQIFRNA